MLKLLSICALVGIGALAMSASGPDQGQAPQTPQQPPAPAQYSADLKVGDAAPDFT